MGDMIRFGWDTFKKRPWFFVGVNLFLTVISVISAQIAAAATTPEWNLSGIALTLLDFLVVQVLVLMGTTSLFLKAHDNVEGTMFGDAWAPQKYWKFLGAYVLTFIIIVGGLVLLIIPGIILSMVLYFTIFLVIDRGMGPLQALSESARITKGHRWELFLFTLALVLVNILGFLAIFVGLLVSVPVSWFAMMHAYRTLEHQASEVVAGV